MSKNIPPHTDSFPPLLEGAGGGFKTILIANRGEIAVRVIRAAQKSDIRTVAVYAADDADSLHVSMADEAVLLAGKTLAETYLNQKKIIQIAKNSGAEAIHPGYGFLSENAGFAQKVIESGLAFIGPSPENKKPNVRRSAISETENCSSKNICLAPVTSKCNFWLIIMGKSSTFMNVNVPCNAAFRRL
jgi:pyruvate carboxylase